MAQPVTDPLVAARDAFQAREWDRALDLFKQADDQERLAPEDMESMAEAAWWGARPDEGIESFQRAYSAYLEAGKPLRAGYVAVTLAREFAVKHAGPVASSWFNRAKKLLESQPEGAEHGYLYARESVLALHQGNAEEAIAFAQRAMDVGARIGDANLQAIGSVYQGGALVESGKVAEGLRLYDDAALAAVNGELGLYATGVVYCNTISTCCELADYRRAGEWSDAARRWSRAHPANQLIPGDCRVHEAEVLAMRGAWAEAEASARQGAEELRAFNRLYHVGEALYQMGVIRLRMGDLVAADDAFRQASELGRDPQPGLALLLLSRGKTDSALSSVRRALDEETSTLSRGRLLPSAVRVALEAGQTELAETWADELDSTAGTYETPTLRGAAAVARASLLLASGNPKASARGLRDGLKQWQEIEAPYEVAQTRLLLARAMAAQGDFEGARLERAAARSTFERLGAIRDVAEVDALDQEGEPSAPVAQVLKTFMFSDIVKSTNLVEAIGDEAWVDLLRWHDQTLRELFAAHGGQELDHAGDGFFVAFDDPAAAIGCAVAIQSSLAEHRRAHGFAPQVRIGVHATPASRSAGTYRGKGVHVAARIGAVAEAGEILASLSSAEATQSRFTLSPPRTVTLKGISKPVDVVAIDWRT
jgi:class 3 adenylate cyclase